MRGSEAKLGVLLIPQYEEEDKQTTEEGAKMKMTATKRNSKNMLQ